MPRHVAGGYEKSQSGPVNYLESTQPCKMLTTWTFRPSVWSQHRPRGQHRPRQGAARRAANSADATAKVDGTAPTDDRPPCPSCGGRMIVVQTFERGRGPRDPPPLEPEVRPAAA
jgi:hypothetical protein